MGNFGRCSQKDHWQFRRDHASVLSQDAEWSYSKAQHTRPSEEHLPEQQATRYLTACFAAFNEQVNQCQ